MSVVSYIDLARLVDEAGFPRGLEQARAIAVCCAESGRNPAAVNVNEGGSAPGSRDRGLFQINDYWHPEVPDEVAFDPAGACRAALAIQQGAGWGAWAAYTNNAYERYLEPAKVALNGYERERKLQAQLTRLDGQLAELTEQAARANAQLDQTLAAWHDEVGLLRGEISVATAKITAALEALR